MYENLSIVHFKKVNWVYLNYILIKMFKKNIKLTSYLYNHVNSQMLSIPICVTLGKSPNSSYLICKIEIVRVA